MSDQRREWQDRLVDRALREAIGEELRQLGVRRSPVLGFLRRQNTLNRWFGLLRRRVDQEAPDFGPFRV